MASHSSTRPVEDDLSNAATNIMTQADEEDLSEWPELRSREGDQVDLRRHPIQWGQGLQNEDEEYLDQLRE